MPSRSTVLFLNLGDDASAYNSRRDYRLVILFALPESRHANKEGYVVVQIALSSAEFENLNEQSIDDLYADLALADAGTAGPSGLDLSGLSSMKHAMSDASVTSKWGWLIEKGKALFNSLWPKAKSVVCAIYREDDGTGNLKDWVAKVAAALLGLINVTAAVAVLIATIAMKHGLDALCSTDAPQPA